MLLALSLGVFVGNVFIGRLQYKSWKDGFFIGLIASVLCFGYGSLILKML